MAENERKLHVGKMVFMKVKDIQEFLAATEIIKIPRKRDEDPSIFKTTTVPIPPDPTEAVTTIPKVDQPRVSAIDVVKKMMELKGFHKVLDFRNQIVTIGRTDRDKEKYPDPTVAFDSVRQLSRSGQIRLEPVTKNGAVEWFLTNTGMKDLTIRRGDQDISVEKSRLTQLVHEDLIVLEKEDGSRALEIRCIQVRETIILGFVEY